MSNDISRYVGLIRTTTLSSRIWLLGGNCWKKPPKICICYLFSTSCMIWKNIMGGTKVLIPSSSRLMTQCHLHLKTRFQHLKTRFHCHSVFVVHTNTPGRRLENLNDTQFGYFGHLQMICQHQMMCDVMKTTLSKDTSHRSDLLKPCASKMWHLQLIFSKMWSLAKSLSLNFYLSFHSLLAIMLARI
jgi:hypothetical protein